MGRLKALKPKLGSVPNRLSPAASDARRSGTRIKHDNSGGKYKTARWQKLRQKILKRDSWKCQQTGVLVIGKYPAPNSPVVDHIIPHRGNDDLFWDESNLQLVSKEYHDKTKQQLEARGLIG